MGGNKNKQKAKSKAQAKRAERARRRDPDVAAAEKHLNGIRSDLADMQLADRDAAGRRRLRDRGSIPDDFVPLAHSQRPGPSSGRGGSSAPSRGRGGRGGRGRGGHHSRQQHQQSPPTGFQAAFPNFHFHAGLGFKARHSHLYDMLEVDYGSSLKAPAPNRTMSSTSTRGGGGGRGARDLQLTPELKKITSTAPIFPHEVVFTGPTYVLDQFHIRFVKGPTLGGGIPDEVPTIQPVEPTATTEDEALKKAEEAEDWALHMLLGPETDPEDPSEPSDSDTDDEMDADEQEQEEDAEMDDGFSVQLDADLAFDEGGGSDDSESESSSEQEEEDDDDASDVMSLVSDHGNYDLDSDSDAEGPIAPDRMDVDPPLPHHDDDASSSDLEDLFSIDTTPMTPSEALMATGSSSASLSQPLSRVPALGRKQATRTKPTPSSSSAINLPTPASMVDDLREYMLDDYDDEELHPNLVAVGHHRSTRRQGSRNTSSSSQPATAHTGDVNMQSPEDVRLAKYVGNTLSSSGFSSDDSDGDSDDESNDGSDMDISSMDGGDDDIAEGSNGGSDFDSEDDCDSDSSRDNNLDASETEVMLRSMVTGEDRAMLQFMLMRSDDDSETEALVRDYIENVGRGHASDDSDTGGVFGNAHVLKWAQQRTGAGLLDNGDIEHDPFMFPKPGMRRNKSGGQNKRDKGAKRKDKADPYGFGDRVYVGKSKKKGEKRRKGQLYSSVDIGEVHEIIQQFMADPFEQTQLPPMAKQQRKVVNSISKCYQLKSKALGSGHTRRVELIKTKHSVAPTGDRRRKLDALLHSHAYTPVTESWGGISGKGKGKAKAGAAASGPPVPRKVLPGYVVGKHARPLDEENVGHKLLQALGWAPGSGIGKSSGIQVPIVAVVRGRNRGLGAES